MLVSLIKVKSSKTHKHEFGQADTAKLQSCAIVRSSSVSFTRSRTIAAAQTRPVFRTVNNSRAALELIDK